MVEMHKEPVFCNLCGSKFDFWDEQADFSIHKDRITYGSKYDMASLSIRWCCRCIDKTIDLCVITPVSDGLE